MTRALAFALLLLPSLALGQESKKFNAKELEKDFAEVGVFAPKNVTVVENEVMVAQEEKRDFMEAVYVVKADLKKVLDYYKAKLVLEPKKDGEEELGSFRYTFAPAPKHNAKRLYKVTVEPVEGGGTGTVIRLMHRKPTDDDPRAPSDD